MKNKPNSIRKLKSDKIAFEESELGQMFKKIKEKKIVENQDSSDNKKINEKIYVDGLKEPNTEKIIMKNFN